jgi:hypothetical protein
MRTVIAGMLLMAVAGTLAAMEPVNLSPRASGFQSYLTIGDNVVAISRQIQSGDNVILTDSRGQMVYRNRVSGSEARYDKLNVGIGMYILVIERSGKPIAAARVPIANE